MITAVKNKVYTIKRYPTSVTLSDIFGITLLDIYIGKPSIKLKLLKKRCHHTVIIDLSKDSEELLQGCKSNTRNEIRRAMREGVTFGYVDSINDFVEYYNAFAKEKGLDTISRNNVAKYGSNLVLTKCMHEDKILSMHASLVDDESKRSSLLYSASIRLAEGVDRKLIGMSNRYLHYDDFLAFKERGCDSYDFSGVCNDPNQPEKYNIGIFKKSFGGEEVDQVSYASYPFLLAYAVKRLIRK